MPGAAEESRYSAAGWCGFSAQDLRALEGEAGVGREHGDLVGVRVLAEVGGGPGGHGVVVRRGVGEGQGGQAPAGAQVEAAGLGGLDDLAVAGRVHDDRHGRVVLRGRAHHGRPADVDLLDDGVLRGARVHGVHERVEVHDDEVERLHLELAQLGHVVLTTTVGQDARVHARVQRLHAAVQALLEPGDLGDLGDGHAGGGDALGGGAGRDDLHARGVEPGGELLEAGLVVHGDQGPLQGHRVQDGGDGLGRGHEGALLRGGPGASSSIGRAA